MTAYLSAREPFQECAGDPAQRQYLIDGIEQDHFARHPEDHGCRFVLSNGEIFMAALSRRLAEDCPGRTA